MKRSIRENGGTQDMVAVWPNRIGKDPSTVLSLLALVYSGANPPPTIDHVLNRALPMAFRGLSSAGPDRGPSRV